MEPEVAVKLATSLLNTKTLSQGVHERSVQAELVDRLSPLSEAHGRRAVRWVQNDKYPLGIGQLMQAIEATADRRGAVEDRIQSRARQLAAPARNPMTKEQLDQASRRKWPNSRGFGRVVLNMWREGAGLEPLK